MKERMCVLGQRETEVEVGGCVCVCVRGKVGVDTHPLHLWAD